MIPSSRTVLKPRNAQKVVYPVLGINQGHPTTQMSTEDSSPAWRSTVTKS